MTVKIICATMFALFAVNNALPMNRYETAAVNGPFLLNMQTDIHEKMDAIKQNLLYLERYIQKACSLTCNAYEKYLFEHNKRSPGYRLRGARERARDYLIDARINLSAELKQIKQVRRDFGNKTMRKKAADNGTKIINKPNFLRDLNGYIDQYKKRINDVQTLK